VTDFDRQTYLQPPRLVARCICDHLLFDYSTGRKACVTSPYCPTNVCRYGGR